MSHEAVPASPFGHSTTHFAPDSQVEWHGDAEQVKVHSAPGPQPHCPLAHVPRQIASDAQLTWQGGAAQLKSQRLLGPHVQVPFAHAPVHEALLPSH
jgi:hypothetical protein